MKKLLTLAAAAALAATAHAQIQTGPGSISEVTPQTAAVWQTVFAPYNISSNATEMQPDTSTWGTSSTALNAQLSSIKTTGGAMRIVLLGETAGWSNDLGVNIGGASSTLLAGIQSPVNMHFGDWIYWTFAANTTTSFDLWFHSNGDAPLGGATYSIFNATTNVRISNPFNVMNYADGQNGTNLQTFLVGVEDWNLRAGSDADYNDLLFAVQFTAGGSPFTPVPEPSTYGLIGAAALLGLVMVRRFKAKK